LNHDSYREEAGSRKRKEEEKVVNYIKVRSKLKLVKKDLSILYFSNNSTFETCLLC